MGYKCLVNDRESFKTTTIGGIPQALPKMAKVTDVQRET